MGNGESQVEEESTPLPYQYGYQILKIQPNSPCDGKKLKIFFEFIIGVNGQSVDITNVESFLDLLKGNPNKPLKLTILDCKARHIREIKTVPSLNWGSKQHLGINIRLCSTKLATSLVWHILEVYPNSPASIAGLETNNDYIIGTPSFVFSDDEDLFTLISSSVGKPLNFFVYNHLREDVRMVTITSNDNWGGAGCLGCDVGYGALHKLPGVSNSPFTSEPNMTPLTPYNENSQQPQQLLPPQHQPPPTKEDQKGEEERGKRKEKEEEGAVKITDLKEEEEEQEMLPPLAAPPPDLTLSSSPSPHTSLPPTSSPLLTEVDPSTSSNPLSPPLVSPIPHQRASIPEQPIPTTTPITITEPEQPQQQQLEEEQQAPLLLQPSAHPPNKEGPPSPTQERLSSSVPHTYASPPLSLPTTSTTTPTTPPTTPPSTPTADTPSRAGNQELENNKLEILQKKKKELEARLAMMKKGGSGSGSESAAAGASASGSALSAETKARMEARLAELRAKQT